MVSNILSGLKIKCDYSHRVCQEYIRLEELDSHIESCGFSPVKCSNEECEMIANKREIIHHESTVCEYRKVKCHNCVKIEQKVEEMKEKMEEKMGRIAADVVEVKELMAKMFEKLPFLENSIQISSAVNHTFMKDILVAGGWDRDGFINYDNQVFVAGGCDNPVIEVLNSNEDPTQWQISKATLPFNCCSLCSFVYQYCAVLFCTCGETDYCAELSLTATYICKACKMLSRKGDFTQWFLSSTKS